jgi:hypothetical protein
MVRKDSSPPSVRGAATRGPDANGWYNHAVTVEFSGSDSLSGIASCSTTTYSGPDSPKAGVGGSCRDGAGNTRSTTYEIKYDATAPTTEAKTDRAPDANGWFNHAVTVAFVGTDAASGIDTCAPSVVYKGPDTEKTSLSGTCRDKAANTSQPAGLDLKYDATPPSLARVKAAIGKRGIVLRWTASKDSLTFGVVRRPGLRGPKPSTIYDGGARNFTDHRLARGTKYRYTVTAYDQAGNGSVKTLVAKSSESLANPVRQTPARQAPARATPALASPALGARLSKPPLLRWSAVPKATYYNVQLYHNGRKVLSLWPKRTQFQLRQTWKYGGHRYALRPGKYRWLVWPGFDALSANRYGKLIGSRTFFVTSH